MKTIFRPFLLLLLIPALIATDIAAAEKGKRAKDRAVTRDIPQGKVRALGVLLFPGFETLDACGPVQIWGNLKNQIHVVTVAQQKGEVPSQQGPKMVADYDFDDCPPLDLVLIPGGFGVGKVLKDPMTLEWLRMVSPKAEITMSVCNGASILAATGLLDGRPATTNKAYWSFATRSGPKVKWVTKARWVDDGNIVTSSGVSAGIDMSLHVAGRLFGLEVAEALANESEYEWHRDTTWDPFAKLHGLEGRAQ